VKAYRYFGREYFISPGNYAVVSIIKLIVECSSHSKSTKIKALSFYKILFDPRFIGRPREIILVIVLNKLFITA
jgi:hypothetical protein